MSVKPKWKIAVAALWVIIIISAFLLQSGQAQQAEVYVGMIVTRSAEDAQAVLNQLKAGMDFGVLAKEKSVDPSSNDGGYIGGLLTPALRDAVRGISSGQFTGIVRVPSGFAILTVFPAPPKTQDLDAKQIQALASATVMRQTINVDGMSKEDSVLEQYSKPADWKQDLRQPCAIRKAAHPAAVERMEQVLAICWDMDKSIREWQSAYQIAQSAVPGAVYAGSARRFLPAPLRDGKWSLSPVGAHFDKPENSRLAIQYFLSFLQTAPEDLQVRWLLDLAYLTLGEYPAQVPPKYRVPMSYFESKDSVGRFTDVAREAGLNVFSAAGGAVVDDFENNGLLDVITSSSDMCDPLHYFHNNGDGTFTDRTVQAGLSGQLGGLNIIQADYINDGCMDLLVLRAGWEFPIRKSLLRNNCDGTFTDVTEKSGLSGTPAPTQTAAWADVDNDGYLDLFIGNDERS